MHLILKIVRASCLLIATVATLVFFISNRQIVSISLFPLPLSFDVPLFLPPAFAAGVALLLGYLLGVLPLRGKIKSLQKELKQLHNKNTSLTDENSVLRSQILGSAHTGESLHYYQQDTSRMLQPASELIQDVTRARR